MAYCRSCGGTVSGKERFCRTCGVLDHRRVDLGASGQTTTGSTGTAIFGWPLALCSSPSTPDGFTSRRRHESWAEPSLVIVADAVSRGCRRAQRLARETSGRSELAAQSQYDADRARRAPSRQHLRCYRSNGENYPRGQVLLRDLQTSDPTLSFAFGPQSVSPNFASGPYVATSISVAVSSDGFEIMFAAQGTDGACWYATSNHEVNTSGGSIDGVASIRGDLLRNGRRSAELHCRRRAPVGCHEMGNELAQQPLSSSTQSQSKTSQGATDPQSSNPVGWWRPSTPCSKRPQPSCPSQTARATWSTTPNARETQGLRDR